jgi:protein-tyrosine phosphatase
MTAFTWWIDEASMKGSRNPSDEDPRELHAQGFSVAVSLLVESEQPPRYDKESAQAAGWSIHSIPIAENQAPSLEQIRDFVTRLIGLPEKTKVLVFCESGLGHTAFMGAAYWVKKGLSSRDAITRVSEACRVTDWVTADRRRVLDDYARLTKG